MTVDRAWEGIAEGISDRQVLALEQAAIRIPSTTFEEGALADHLANYMTDIGLDVEMMDVTHPAKPGKRTRQPIGRLRGTGGGPSLMLNGHMDPGVEMSGWTVDPYGAKFEDGWIWGMGAHDDKGGVVAAICARRGDRQGRRAAPRRRARVPGGRPQARRRRHPRAARSTACGPTWRSTWSTPRSRIANVCVGIVMARIRTRSPELFFRYSAEARAAYMNPIEQQCADHRAHRTEPRSRSRRADG